MTFLPFDSSPRRPAGSALRSRGNVPSPFGVMGSGEHALLSLASAGDRDPREPRVTVARETSGKAKSPSGSFYSLALAGLLLTSHGAGLGTSAGHQGLR